MSRIPASDATFRDGDDSEMTARGSKTRRPTRFGLSQNPERRGLGRLNTASAGRAWENPAGAGASSFLIKGEGLGIGKPP